MVVVLGVVIHLSWVAKSLTLTNLIAASSLDTWCIRRCIRFPAEHFQHMHLAHPVGLFQSVYFKIYKKLLLQEGGGGQSSTQVLRIHSKFCLSRYFGIFLLFYTFSNSSLNSTQLLQFYSPHARTINDNCCLILTCQHDFESRVIEFLSYLNSKSSFCRCAIRIRFRWKRRLTQ